MTIRVECPHCGGKSDAPSDLGGKTAICPNCKQKLQVPVPAAKLVADLPPTTLTASTPTEPVPFLVVDRPTRPLRKRSVAPAILRSFLYIASSLGAMYAGHLFVQHRLQLIEEAAKAAATVPEPPVMPRPQRRERALPKQEPTLPQPKPESKPPPLPRPDGPVEVALPSLPKFLQLPDKNDRDTSILIASAIPLELQLVSNSPELNLVEDHITWEAEKAGKATVVAKLAYKDDSMQFRWVDQLEEHVEAAIRNSVLSVSRNGQSSFIALRTPEEVEPFDFDLKKATSRIACKCKHIPPAETIRFDLVDAEKLPSFKADSGSLHDLGLKREVTVRYTSTAGVKSTFSMLKRGTIIIVKIDSLFQLPSGEVEALSISSGVRKHKELSKLIDSANSAKSQLSSIKARLAELQGELGRWKSMRTTSTLNGQQVPNSALAAQKRSGISNTEKAIAFGEARLTKAKRLIADLPKMQVELDSLQAISKVAEQLHNLHNLQYRFFSVVEGNEVDLVATEKHLPTE